MLSESEEVGENLKHLTETMGMGSCWGWYSTKDSKCKECQVSAECKDNTKKKAEAEVNDSGKEVKKARKGKKVKKESITVTTINERTNTLMVNAGFDCIEVKANATSTATMYKYERTNDSANIIFSNTGRVKLICNGSDVIVIDDVKDPQEIFDRVEALCKDEDE